MKQFFFFHSRKAVKATFILLPLLGLHYLVTPFRPSTGSSGEEVYEITAALFASLQVNQENFKFLKTIFIFT